MIDQGAPGRSLRGLRLPRLRRRRPSARRAQATQAARTGATRSTRAGARPRSRLRLTGRRLRVLLALLVAAALLAGGWIWLRDSPLVAVNRVTVTGLSGPEAPRIRAALAAAGRGMTTLDVHEQTLRAAVSPYPVVKGLGVSTSFPHGLRIVVHEQQPVADVSLDGRAVPVAADGTLLHEGEASGTLPTLTVKSLPAGARVQDPNTLAALAVLGGAPAGMAARISGVALDYWHGVVISVRNGPAIYFGHGDLVAAKWQAALAVLAAPSTAGASYVDVSDPRRPAAGSGTNPASATSAGGTSTTSTGGGG